MELLRQHQSELLELCRKYDVLRFNVFGSAARGDFDEIQRDLDFIVEFKNLTVDNAADRYLGLMIDLEDLFGRRVDLVSYPAIRNPYFKQVVDQTRVQLHAA